MHTFIEPVFPVPLYEYNPQRKQKTPRNQHLPLTVTKVHQMSHHAVCIDYLSLTTLAVSA